jgi:hypothetical protein
MRIDRTEIEDVPLGSAVTALAKSSGAQKCPQPSNRRASLHQRVTHGQWFRSSLKDAANRGYAPDAADVFNDTSIKANSAFMLAPLIPQTPFNKGDLKRPSNIMERNYAQSS